MVHESEGIEYYTSVEIGMTENKEERIKIAKMLVSYFFDSKNEGKKYS